MIAGSLAGGLRKDLQSTFGDNSVMGGLRSCVTFSKRDPRSGLSDRRLITLLM